MGDGGLPALWKVFFPPDLWPLPAAGVGSLDCRGCDMARAGRTRPDVKCCNVPPPLPNFLVGAILTAPPDDPGRRVVESWIDRRRCDPLGIEPPPALLQRHREAIAADWLGALPCPWLTAAGACTIYPWRPYLCLGFHCWYVSVRARRTWGMVTTLVALHAALASQVFALDEGLDVERYRAAWGEAESAAVAWSDEGLEEDLFCRVWRDLGDPRRFFRRCWARCRGEVGALRSRMAAYRRRQLIGRLGPSPHDRPRRRQIEDTPDLLQPPAKLLHLLDDGPLAFGDNVWTVEENEAFLRWFLTAEGEPREAHPFDRRQP